jgi:hypothetical protein
MSTAVHGMVCNYTVSGALYNMCCISKAMPQTLKSQQAYNNGEHVLYVSTYSYLPVSHSCIVKFKQFIDI